MKSTLHVHLLIFLLPLLTTLTTAQPGLTLSPCDSSTPCQSPLICSLSTTNPSCPPGSTSCRCIPPSGLTPCKTAEDCLANESCYSTSLSSSTICIASDIGSSIGRPVGVADAASLTLDVCAVDTDCASPRTCQFLAGNSVTPCNGRASCSCLTPAPIKCSADSPCDPGEKCADKPPIGFICISATVVEEEGLQVMDDSQSDQTPVASPVASPAASPAAATPAVAPSPVASPAAASPPAASPAAASPPAASPAAASPPAASPPAVSSPAASPAAVSPLVSPSSSPAPSAVPASGSGTGLVLEECVTSADCLSPRECLDISVQPNVPCNQSSTRCVCGYRRIPICTSDADCASGEACIVRAGTGKDKICVSRAIIGGGASARPTSTPSAAPSQGATITPTAVPPGDDDVASTLEPYPSAETTDSIAVPGVVGEGPVVSSEPTDSGVETSVEPVDGLEPVEEEAVCVDAEALVHLKKEELVFSEDVLSRVLCDAMGSCATAGHMVRWRGRSMMMKSYCELVGCVDKVMKVNSPRYRRGLVVRSRSGGLEFTALAARFGTKFEEHVLRGIIRVGL